MLHRNLSDLVPLSQCVFIIGKHLFFEPMARVLSNPFDFFKRKAVLVKARS